MALYKALMEESLLSRTPEPDIALDMSHEVLSNSEEDNTTSSLLPRNFSCHESITDINDSVSSTNGAMSEMSHTVLNSSRDRLNIRTSCEDPIYVTGEVLSSSASANKLKELTELVVTDTSSSEQSFRQYPYSEDNPGVVCVGTDNPNDHSDSTGRNISDDGNVDVDSYQPAGPVTLQNLDQTVSCFKCQIYRIDSEIEESGDHYRYSDADRVQRKGSLQTQNSTCPNDIVYNKLPPKNEWICDEDITDDGQTRGQCVYLSCQTPDSDKDCSNHIIEHVTTNCVNSSRTNGQTCDDNNSTNSPKNERNIESQGPYEQDVKIQHMDTSQTESLLTKIVHDPTTHTDTNPVFAEALARRDAMVKDLSVDGSGLKVMCCLLGVIVLFAIAIITIVVTGL